jgi:hypothetical protein
MNWDRIGKEDMMRTTRVSQADKVLDPLATIKDKLKREKKDTRRAIQHLEMVLGNMSSNSIDFPIVDFRANFVIAKRKMSQKQASYLIGVARRNSIGIDNHLISILTLTAKEQDFLKRRIARSK